jgi:ATP-dependent Lon protease
MSTAIYPMGAMALIVGIPENLKLLKDYSNDDAVIALVPTLTRNSEITSPQDIAEIGVACRMIDRSRLPGGSVQITFQGIRRISLREIIGHDPYIVARVSKPARQKRDRTRETTLVGKITTLMEKLIQKDRRYGRELIHIVKMNTGEPGRFADVVAAHIQIDLDLKKELMCTVQAERRLEMLRQFIRDELQRISLIESIESKAEDHFEEARRRTLLMERLRVIRRELGEEEPQEAMANRIREQMENLSLPKDVRSNLDWELERLKLLPITSHDFRSVCNYIEWLLGIPWTAEPASQIDLENIEKMLKKEYHALFNVKAKILESLSPLALNPELTPPVLCIVGPPATGKTSIGRSLAEALGRKFAHFSVAGCKDDGDIKGIRRGLIGESPGMVINVLRTAGTKDFLMVIEDIDEMSEEPARGNPIDALVELFDPTRNCNFMDRYLNVPIDMSRVFFVTTAKVFWEIPDQIRDYVKFVYLSGYTDREKIQIARRFIIPRELRKAGLEKKRLKFESSAIRKIIRGYTDEGGLRQLERTIELVATRCAHELATGKRRKWKIDSKGVMKLIGPQRYPAKRSRKRYRIGVATGLAWTSNGGDLLTIEGLRMPGNGELILTGQLGEVMKESVQAAHSYIKSKAYGFGIENSVFEDFDIHIHFPEGAIPKDGPSAGVSIAAVIASVLGNIPIRANMAMTGEVTLSGKVIGVGGLTEKLMAAYRAGLRTVIFPAENRADLDDVPREIRTRMNLIEVSKIDEVLSNVLIIKEKKRKRR